MGMMANSSGEGIAVLVRANRSLKQACTEPSDAKQPLKLDIWAGINPVETPGKPAVQSSLLPRYNTLADHDDFEYGYRL